MKFGLYVHWPYCQSKCPYCDFNSHVATAIDPERWISAYQHEISRIAEACPDHILSTIFIGGGTPSLMDPRIVDSLVRSATDAWRTANDIEISMEANPGSVESGRFKSYALAGVNRVSLGVQSLNDDHLARLGRLHGRREALRAVEIAQANFQRVNLDLIYARQHQTIPDWSAELNEAISLGTGHLSLYQLTIEDGTVFSRRHSAGQLKGLPDEDSAAEMFELTQDICEAAGLPAYEVSNHARIDEQCRHNLIYWNSGIYAGVGPGAHGRVMLGHQRVATEAIRDPRAWLEAVETQGSGDLPTVELSQDEQTAETILMGLRLVDGIPNSTFARMGVNLNTWTSLVEMTQEGYLARSDHAVQATPKGRILLNSVIARLLSDIAEH
ncbi:oxygen-independent coproporphyrinogen-3 oxidase [Gemmobacter megaterium]|uniref:Heme chaperone HemW n=1 Tax=Gemmobacter megaterium TaxID=1086013 RepID=A0A1N7PPY9_9RHOB|nr:radical SAM family heme chaperone HemW [Gemmobacter megaterium]SIT12547.1 oxygen-independent coproporphyrinogen-3 oxidase [Gemmobacter megaterium]